MLVGEASIRGMGYEINGPMWGGGLIFEGVFKRGGGVFEGLQFKNILPHIYQNVSSA